MALPTEPVTLSVGKLAELQRQLSQMRHDINNNLALIIAAVDLMRSKPQMAERLLATLSEQPSKIAGSVAQFSAAFDATLGISKE